MKLLVVIASTRPGRVGLPVGTWFASYAKTHGKFDVEVADLKEVNLPLLDEAQHPRFQKYEHAHTKKWSAIVDGADAFAFVTPEYDFAMPASLANALQCLFLEWRYKPACFVSYGGISGGIRAVQMAKMLVTSLSMMPIATAVPIPMVHGQIDKEKQVFNANEVNAKSASDMLDELHKWATAMKTMRS